MEQIKMNKKWLEENHDIFNALYQRAFPSTEKMSFKDLTEMIEEKEMEGFAYYEKIDFCGFALVNLYREFAYLYYLAISPIKRDQGYGSKALALLKKQYPSKQIVMEIEEEDSSRDNAIQREKRIRFYKRNGFEPSGWYLHYNHDNFIVMTSCKPFKYQDFAEIVNTWKEAGFPVAFNQQSKQDI